MNKFQGVPQTTAPRQHKTDKQLYNAQRKMENAMQLLLNYTETNDKKDLTTLAAHLRSAWEDTQQHRRWLLAGKQAYKLEKRQDDTRPRLLTEEENKKIQRFPKPTASNWGNRRPNMNGRDQAQFSTSQPKEKGQGKGERKRQRKFHVKGPRSRKVHNWTWEQCQWTTSKKHWKTT